MNISKIKTVSQNILLAVIALVPILFVPTYIGNLPILKTFIISITSVIFLISLIIYKIKQDSFYFSKDKLIILLGLVSLTTLLSSLFSTNVMVSLIGRQLSENSLLGLLMLAILSYVTYSFFFETESKIKLFILMYISGVCTILLHILLITINFIPTLGFFTTNATNTIGTWVDLGLYGLFVALSSVFILQFFGQVNLYKKIGWVGLVSSLLLLILVNSKSIFILSVVFSFLIILFNAVSNRKQEAHKKISYESLIIFVVSILFLLIGGKTGVFTSSFFNINVNEPRPNLTATLQTVSGVIQNQPIQNKIFGMGVDRFDVAWLLYKPTEVNLSAYWDTDFRFGFSTLSTYASTQGVLGVLLWIVLLGMIMYFAVKLAFTSTKQKSESFVYIYSACMTIFFGVLLFVYTPSIVLLMLMFVFFGIYISNLEHTKLIQFKEVLITKSPRTSFAYIFALVLFLIGAIYMGYVFTSQYASRVIFDQATIQYSKDGDIAKLENQIQKARFIFDSDMYLRGLSDVGLLKINTVLQDKSISQDQAVNQFTQFLRNTISASQAAIMYDSSSYANRIVLINIYKNLIPLGVSDAKAEAFKLIEATEKITPNNPTLVLEKARIYVLTKEYDLAIQEIKKAIELKSNYIDAVFLLSQIQAEKGEIDQAISSIQAGTVVEPNNPNLHFQLGLLYYNKQSYNDAIVYFENATKLSPGFANAEYFLGLSYYKNNRTSDALSTFEKLHAQIPDNQEVSFILNNLKSGQDPFSGAQPPLTDSPESREELPLEDGKSDTTKSE